VEECPFCERSGLRGRPEVDRRPGKASGLDWILATGSILGLPFLLILVPRDDALGCSIRGALVALWIVAIFAKRWWASKASKERGDCWWCSACGIEGTWEHFHSSAFEDVDVLGQPRRPQRKRKGAIIR
jgi:hypothetical protein